MNVQEERVDLRSRSKDHGSGKNRRRQENDRAFVPPALDHAIDERI